MTTNLVYIGPNPENISGMSSKFYRVEPLGNGMWRTTWGKIGTSGQSKTVSENEAKAKVREKRRKGYVDASAKGAAPVVTPAPKLSLVERARAAIGGLSAMGFDAFVKLIAGHELVELLDSDGFRFYLEPDRDHVWVAQRLGSERFLLGNLGARS